jgi:hypothetical protein
MGILHAVPTPDPGSIMAPPAHRATTPTMATIRAESSLVMVMAFPGGTMVPGGVALVVDAGRNAKRAAVRGRSTA